MKANEAPEKLYLSKNIYSTYLYQVPDPDDETAVEYTCTDAFIEKAFEFFGEHLWEYIDVKNAICATFINVDSDKLKEDFKNYMKGE